MSSTIRQDSQVKSQGRLEYLGGYRILVRPVVPVEGSALAPLAEELGMTAIRLVAANPGVVAGTSSLIAATRGFTDLLAAGHIPGQSVAAVDIAVEGDRDGRPSLAIHLLLGIAGPAGTTAGQALLFAQMASALLSQFPACYGIAPGDPVPLLEGLVQFRHGARITQRRIGLGNDYDTIEVLSRFEREANSWLPLCEVLLDQPIGTRIRSTMLATELDLADRSGLEESIRAAQRVSTVHSDDSSTCLRVQRILNTLVDLDESYQSPVFVAEIALGSPEPLPELYVRMVGSAITNEIDVINGGGTPTVAARMRLVGGFEVEWDPDSLYAALSGGLPLRGGIGPRELGDLVSLTEAGCAFQWSVPAGAPIPTIPTETILALRAPAGLAQSGTMIGSDSVGRSVHISDAQRSSHIHLIGTTGTGKSTLISTLVAADLFAGKPFVLIDPHGDVTRRIRSSSRGRDGSLVIVDPSDPETPGLEVFDGALSERIDAVERIEASVSRIVDAIASSMDRSWTGPRFRQAARSALLLLAYAGEGHHLGEVGMVLSDADFANELLAEAKHVPNWVRRNLSNFARQNEKADVVDYVSSKFSDFSYRGAIRRVFPPIGTGLSIPELLAAGRSLVVSLAIGMLSATDAGLIGNLVASLVIDEVFRSYQGKCQARSLYVDEAQLLPATALARALAEGRKFGLSLVVAHQHLVQLDPILQDALGNAKSQFVFRVTTEDARRLSPLLGLDQARLTSVPDLHAYARLYANGRPLAPFSVSLDPPSGYG